MTKTKGIVRIVGTDIKGDKSLYSALRQIKGMGFMMANAVCKISKLNPKSRVGDLSESDIHRIEEIIKNPKKHGINEWMFNRRKDIKTGENLHLTGADLEITQREDIKRMIDIQSYRGIRHMLGLKVRGQRTRSTGRKGRTVGVIRKKSMPQKKKKGA